MNNDVVIIDEEKIKNKIYIVRGQKVMLDADLAQIYGYTTKAFNQQVKNNIEKFDSDFMFKLTSDEAKEILRSKKFTLKVDGDFYESSRSKILTLNEGRGHNIKYLPYAFTEQGVYMLMTVLKGELATKQSKALIRIFKEMKDYIITLNEKISGDDVIKLAIQVNQNTREIKEIKEKMVTKSDLADMIKGFISNDKYKETLLLNGEIVEADIALSDIYKQAKNKIFIIDNYISLKTLIMLKDLDNIEITIFSDNIHNGLTKLEYDEFSNEYPSVKLNFIKTNKIFHDRYIIIDYNCDNEKIYHSGASIKDAGKRINTIMEIKDIEAYRLLINKILTNQRLILK